MALVSRKHIRRRVETKLNGEKARDRATAYHLAHSYPLYAQFVGRKMSTPKQYADPKSFGEFLEEVNWEEGHIVIRV